ncbi:adenylate/guanylate cyclase domain-containing protein [Legionella steigerwaltii]|nr:adenylate/guanylate cyclase domain-containing protein [Legionella steigerwaltii]
MLYPPILFILKALKFLVWCLILTIILGAVAPYISHIHSYSYLTSLLGVDHAIHENIKHYIPTRVGGWDISRLITIIGLLIVSSIISKCIFVIQKAKIKANIKEFKNKTMTAEQQSLIHSMEETIGSSKFKEKSRQQLVKQFVELKKELEKTGRDLSFLAIDVVESTEMKVGEDPVVVEHDFNQYHDFISCKFKENGFIKASWTPDGVMACFNTTEQAIAAARDILLSLTDFNKSIKMMKRDFHIRCGINTGFVYYDLSTPLEEFSDRVIDIAGHMQKHAPIDTVLIAKDLVKPIESHELFEPTKNTVDGFEVYEWSSATNVKNPN